METITKNDVQTVEYKQLVGKGANTGVSGDYVIEQQGAAEGFSRISQYWLPQTLSYEECLEQFAQEKANREDIISPWENWKFALQNRNLVLEYADGRKFVPTEHALGQAMKWSSILPSHVMNTLAPEFQADDDDLDQLIQTLNHRKERHHTTDKNEQRELRFRTYNNGSLRAVLTTQYSPIDSEWVIKLFSDLIKDGRVSHLRGNADQMFMNILMPDSVRHEEDSDYGGLIAVKNSEIGTSSFDCCPALVRAICRNGCLHQQESGINLRQVHKGKIELDGLAKKVAENVDGQIKLIPELMENFLRLRQYEFHDVGLTGVFAAVSERFKFKPQQAKDIIEQYAKYERMNENAFGVIAGVTRASQLYDAETTYQMDLIGGQLVNENWDKLVNRAKQYSREDIAKILGTSA